MKKKISVRINKRWYLNLRIRTEIWLWKRLLGLIINNDKLNKKF